jgi:hypothetical protein
VDFALLPYQNHPAIWNKMPTNLFEAAALGVPVLVSPNPIWLDFLNNFKGGFPIDFLNVESAITLFNQARLQTFFLLKNHRIQFSGKAKNGLSPNPSSHLFPKINAWITLRCYPPVSNS